MRCLRFTLISLLLAGPISAQASDLSYETYINSDQRIKCLYGYFAEKTGDHATAIHIFEDCIQRWNDVYSMIWLAQIYETGVGVEQDLAYATALMKRGAELDAGTAYSTIARYHYGKALYQGSGTDMNQGEGLKWLERAAAEGSTDAKVFLDHIEAGLIEAHLPDALSDSKPVADFED